MTLNLAIKGDTKRVNTDYIKFPQTEPLLVLKQPQIAFSKYQI